MAFSQAILIEASLSYLGLSAQPPTPSWGNMLNEGRTYLETAPWISVFPGIAIMVAVLAFNLLGDGLRDILDPNTAMTATDDEETPPMTRDMTRPALTSAAATLLRVGAGSASAPSPWPRPAVGPVAPARRHVRVGADHRGDRARPPARARLLAQPPVAALLQPARALRRRPARRSPSWPSRGR